MRFFGVDSMCATRHLLWLHATTERDWYASVTVHTARAPFCTLILLSNYCMLAWHSRGCQNKLNLSKDTQFYTLRRNKRNGWHPEIKSGWHPEIKSELGPPAIHLPPPPPPRKGSPGHMCACACASPMPHTWLLYSTTGQIL